MTKKADRRTKQIEQRAVETINKYHGYRGTAIAYGKLTIREIRDYAKDVLFLCKEIEKAKERK